MGNLEQLTQDTFNDYISSGISVIDFWAPWCPPCKSFGPVFEAVAGKYPAVKFGKVNVDDNPGIAQQYGIRAIPTILFYNDGVQVERMIGGMDEKRFYEAVSDVINKTVKL